MTSLPILVFHSGPCFYAQLALAHAKAFCPRSRVVLIGTDHDAARRAGVEFVDVASVFTEAAEFAKIYRHQSRNRYELELLCFQRWFCMREFLVREKLDGFIHLDSDVLVYANLEEDPLIHGGREFGLAKCMGPHVMFVRNRAFLERYLELINTAYRSPEAMEQVMQRFHSLKGTPRMGGVSDMLFWEFLSLDEPSRYVDMCTPVSGAVHDHHLYHGHGEYLMAGGRKQLDWREGLPHGTTAAGEPIRFRSLHFQGIAKPLMARWRHASVPFPLVDRLRFHARIFALYASKVPGAVRKRLKPGGVT